MSDFILAKSSIVPVSIETLFNTTNAPVDTQKNNSSKAVDQGFDDESSGTDTDDDDDENDHQQEASQEENAVEENDNPSIDNNNRDTEEDDDQGDEGQVHVRPQRQAKIDAYRTRLWLRDQETDDEADDHVEVDQIDGHIITPDSITPEISPVKELDSHDADSSSDSSVFQTHSNITNLEWDNYASSPDLSGCSWTDPPNCHETTVSPIPQYYFNRKYPTRIPLRHRQRVKSYSENDVNQVENEGSSTEDHGCFSTRVFFRRFRQTFGMSSRSVPNLQETSL